MPFDGLDSAKSSLETLGQKANLGTDKRHLETIAKALGEAEKRLQALEVVVRAVALQVKPQNVSAGNRFGIDTHIRKLTSGRGY